MADENGQQDTTGGRRPMTDPRLQAEGSALSPLQIAALWAGYLAAAGLLAFVFWLAVDSSFNLWQKVLLGATIALGIFWGVVHHQAITGAARARGVRLGANSVIFVFFVLGILVLINVLAARHHWREDITEQQLYSLSEQTRAVVQDLEQDLNIVAFLNSQATTQQQNRATAQLRDRLREYEMLSPQVSVETYDPILDQEKADEYEINTLSNVLVIKSGEREEKIYGGDEEQITSAILAVTSGEKARICFLTGHGELSIEDRNMGLTTIKATLESQQYLVEELNLATEEQPSVPGDCGVLVIAGPTEDIREEELDAIAAYARQGGNLLIGLEPGGPDFADILGEHGVDPYVGSVRDRNYGLFGAVEIPAVQAVGQHRIVENLAGIQMGLPTPRALEVTDAGMQDPMAPGQPPQQSAQPLLETSPQAWVEQPGSESDGRDPGEPSGPLTMAAVIDESGAQPQNPAMPTPEQEQEGPRIVVLGDAEMMSDQFIQPRTSGGLGLTGNAYFVLNSVNWLMENEKLITIPPKEDTPRFLTMTAAQKRFVWALVVGIVPIAIAIAGFAVWWRRR